MRDHFDCKDFKTPFKPRQTKLVLGKDKLKIAEMSAADVQTLS